MVRKAHFNRDKLKIEHQISFQSLSGFTDKSNGKTISITWDRVSKSGPGATLRAKIENGTAFIYEEIDFVGTFFRNKRSGKFDQKQLAIKIQEEELQENSSKKTAPKTLGKLVIDLATYCAADTLESLLIKKNSKIAINLLIKPKITHLKRNTLTKVTSKAASDKSNESKKTTEILGIEYYVGESFSENESEGSDGTSDSEDGNMTDDQDNSEVSRLKKTLAVTEGEALDRLSEIQTLQAEIKSLNNKFAAERKVKLKYKRLSKRTTFEAQKLEKSHSEELLRRDSVVLQQNLTFKDMIAFQSLKLEQKATKTELKKQKEENDILKEQIEKLCNEDQVLDKNKKALEEKDKKINTLQSDLNKARNELNSALMDNFNAEEGKNKRDSKTVKDNKPSPSFVSLETKFQQKDKELENFVKQNQELKAQVKVHKSNLKRIILEKDRMEQIQFTESTKTEMQTRELKILNESISQKLSVSQTNFTKANQKIKRLEEKLQLSQIQNQTMLEDLKVVNIDIKENNSNKNKNKDSKSTKFKQVDIESRNFNLSTENFLHLTGEIKSRTIELKNVKFLKKHIYLSKTKCNEDGVPIAAQEIFVKILSIKELKERDLFFRTVVNSISNLCERSNIDSLIYWLTVCGFLVTQLKSEAETLPQLNLMYNLMCQIHENTVFNCMSILNFLLVACFLKTGTISKNSENFGNLDNLGNAAKPIIYILEMQKNNLVEAKLPVFLIKIFFQNLFYLMNAKLFNSLKPEYCTTGKSVLTRMEIGGLKDWAETQGYYEAAEEIEPILESLTLFGLDNKSILSDSSVLQQVCPHLNISRILHVLDKFKPAENEERLPAATLKILQDMQDLQDEKDNREVLYNTNTVPYKISQSKFEL